MPKSPEPEFFFIVGWFLIIWGCAILWGGAGVLIGVGALLVTLSILRVAEMDLDERRATSLDGR